MLKEITIGCVSYIAGVLTLPGLIAGYALWDYIGSREKPLPGSNLKGPIK